MADEQGSNRLLAFEIKQAHSYLPEKVGKAYMNYTTVKRLLAYQSQDELFKIIAKLSSRNDKADSWLLEYCQKIKGGENEKFIAIKRLNHYWKVAREIIKEANKYGGTHNENKGYKTLRKIEELVEEYEFSWEERQPIVDEIMVEFYEGNEIKKYHVSESLLRDGVKRKINLE